MNISDHVYKLRYYMEFRKYSPRSIDNYCSCLTSFFVYFEKLGVYHPDRINSNMIIDFLKQFKESSTHSGYHSAIKLYYKNVTKSSVEKFKYIERPKKSHKLPTIINNEDIQKIIDVCVNVKHKAIILTLYGTGVRVSELLGIKLSDIDGKRGLVRVIGKGNKERNVCLNESLYEYLKYYWKQYETKYWLFENDLTHKQYTAKSIQEFLKKYKGLAGIKYSVTPHKFRHSNATSLLEQGTDLRVIQKLLGHSSSKTTEIYTHVSNNIISKIYSPINNLKIK